MSEWHKYRCVTYARLKNFASDQPILNGRGGRERLQRMRFVAPFRRDARSVPIVETANLDLGYRRGAGFARNNAATHTFGKRQPALGACPRNAGIWNDLYRNRASAGRLQ